MPTVPSSPGLGHRSGGRRVEPYPTASATPRSPRPLRAPRAAPGSEFIKKRQLVVRLGDCSGLPRASLGSWATRSYCLLIQANVAGNAVKAKSRRAEVDDNTGVVPWNDDLYVRYLRSTVLTIQVIAAYTIGKSIVAETKVRATEMFSASELHIFIRGSNSYCTLKMVAAEVKDDSLTELGSLLRSLPAGAQSTTDSSVSRFDRTIAGGQALTSTASAWQVLLDKIEFVADAVEAVLEIHPYARIAWSVIGAGYRLAKNQQQRDDKITSLVESMQAVFDVLAASKALSRMQSRQKGALLALTKQTTECGYFIIDYLDKGFWNRALEGIWSGAEKAIDDYCSRFSELRTAFTEQTTVATQVLVQLVLEQTENIGATMELADMPFTGTARWRSGKQCLPGTRTEIISCILDWAQRSDHLATRVLLLTGLPGTGKSSVAHSVAGYLHDLSRLAASYCFERSHATDHRPEMLFPTIARDLADCHPLFKRELAQTARSATLRATPDIDDQFNNLIRDPLKRLNYIGPLIIVLDALDESASPKDRRALLGILSRRLDELPNNIRFIMTSRPEEDIMATVASSDYVSCLSMDAIDPSSTISDIATFISCRLVGIDGKPVQAFMHEHHLRLARKSEGLFQWAAVACEVILHGDDPDYFLSDEEMLEQYQHFLDLPSGALDELYQDILSRLFSALSASGRHRESPHLKTFRQLLALIIATAEPLSTQALFQLLELSEKERRISVMLLRRLGALLTGVDNPNAPICLLHSSFRDFLLDPSVSGPYSVDVGVSHPLFVSGCFRTLEAELRFNICDLESSYLSNNQVIGLHTRIRDNVSAPLSYASRHWGHHFSALSLITGHTVAYIATLLSKNFLFWLELLSLLGAVHTALPALKAARMKGLPRVMDELLADCIRFIRVFNHPIMVSAPHVYTSAYALAPSSALVRKQGYSRYMSHLVQASGPWNDWPDTEMVIDARGSANSVAISPDSRWIVSTSGEAGMVFVWSAETGRLVGEPLKGHTDVVTSVAFSPDGHRVVSGSHDRTLRIWDIRELETRDSDGVVLAGHTGSVNSVAFSADGRWMASGSHDRTARIWHAQSDMYMQPGQALVKHTSGITTVVFSPDGQRLASGSLDQTVCIWDVETGDLLSELLRGHSQAITSISFSPNGFDIVSGSLDGSLALWHTQTGAFRTRLMGDHTRGITSVAYSPDGRQIVSGSQDRLVCIWDTNTMTLIGLPLEGHTGDIRAVLFSPDGNQVISGSSDATIRVWNVEGRSSADTPLDGYADYISSVAISSDGQRIVSVSHDQSVRVWHAESGVLLGQPLRAHLGDITLVSFSPDGRWIASESENCTVCIWNVDSGSREYVLSGHTGPISAVSFLPDGHRVVSGSQDGTIRIWDGEKQTLIVVLEGHVGAITSIAHSADARMIVSSSVVPASAEESICVWDVQRGSLVRSLFGGHNDSVQSVACSPNGRIIVTGARDWSVCVWNARTGQLLSRSTHGHADVVTSIAFSPDGHWFVSGSNDCTVRMWNAKDYTLVDTALTGHTGAINNVAFSKPADASPMQFVSVSKDRTVRTWSFEAQTRTTFSPDASHALRDYPCLSRSPPDPGTSSEDSTLTSFNLTEDWWIMDVAQEPPRALLWVPPEMRDGLYMPNTLRIIGRRVYSLDLSDFAHGTRWTDCWQGPVSLVRAPV